ncbi:MAG TPA: mechanosensitive ion channel domain-containing protein [Phycisphaerae bacterium]|nr:mechanosensitive ion channel domain-containing protein [Phycisphaerae bacterium]
MNKTLTLLLAWAALGPAALPASAQQAPATMPAEPKVGPADLTVETVQQRLQQAQEAPELEDTVKVRVGELYQQALADLRNAEEWAGKTAEFDKLREEAPGRLEEIRAELAQPLLEAKPEIPPDASLAQLEQLLAQAEAELKATRERATGLDEERARRADRRVKLPEATATAKQKLADRIKDLSTAPPPSEAKEITLARQTSLQARKQALEKEIASYEKEITSYDARGELLTARRDQAARDIARRDLLVKAWQETVNERRRLEVEAAATAARRAHKEAAQKHPAVARLAEENAGLAKERVELAGKIEQVAQEQERIAKTRDQVTAYFKEVTSKVEAAGLTGPMGVLLRQKRETLPDVRRHQRSIAARRSEIPRVQVDLIEYDDQRDALTDVDPLLSEVLAEVGPDAAERDEIESAGRELLQARRGILDGLIGDYNTYFAKVVDLDAEERRLIVEVGRLADYIDQRVLWIRSTTPPRLSDGPLTWSAVRWLLSPQDWAATTGALWSATRASPGATAVALPLFLALLLGRRRLRTRLRTIGREASRSQAQAFSLTVRALVLTLLIAVLWPSVFWFIGWRLAGAFDAPDFAKAVAAGLLAVAVVYVTVSLIRQVCRREGLAEAHFEWPAASLRAIRRCAWWLLIVGLPLVFVVSAVEWTGENESQNSLGRFAFILGQVLLAVLAQRLFRRSGGIFRGGVAATQPGRLHRLRALWYPLGVGLPLLLAVLATAGYYYTALQLADRLLDSVWLILGLALLNALALRWLLVSRRKLAMEQLRQRRAAARDEARQEGKPIPGDEGAEPQLDLSIISTQTRKLLGSLGVIAVVVGLWFIWVDVLPALNILDTVELWSTTEKVTETTVDPQGVAVPRTVEKSVPVTLANMAVALLTLVVASIAAKNVPGLLEIGLLQHLPLQAGERYAITTTARYLIIIVAVVMVASAIGVGWSNVQWLVAAMTVGLGFGLQEIFANFVSGLIILFERPVRIGDIVTVGKVTGKVSRIRTRATTIIDWDRKELVIPNKEFVTGQVVNWSLSDQVLRLVVKVGIAYGSDTRKAQQTLLDVAGRNRRVLSEPPPKALFQEFGSSSLDFELRVWVKDIEDWIIVRHELHQSIDDAFREAGIEIAFPQRDIHVRSVQATLPVMDKKADQ